MKCWPGWANVASTTRWYIVIAAAKLGLERSLRRPSATLSRYSKVLRKPQVRWG